MRLATTNEGRTDVTMKRALTTLAALLLAAAAPAVAQVRAGSTVQIERGAVDVPRGDLFIRNVDAAWTATGEVLEDVSISIRDGVIEAIGPDLSPPDGAEVVDGSGMTAMPGIVDAHSHIAMESTNEGSSAVVPEVRVIDALDHEDFGIFRALSGGVTTAMVLHGSANPIGGQSAMVKTRWGMEEADQLLVQGAPRTVKFALGENVTRKSFDPPGPNRFPSSRIGVEQVYVEAFEAAQEYRDAWEAYREDPDAFTKPPRRDLRLEALVDIMEGNIRVHAHSYRADEIVMLMRVAERFGFQIDVFQHVMEGYKVADEIAEHGAGGSTFSDWWMYKLEVTDAMPYNATIMHRHGVLTSLNSDIPWLQSFLVYEMNKPVKYGGVSKQDALRMLTLYPAQQLHLEDRIGSLETGKDGDVVLLSGDPFDTRSRVVKTIVDGNVYFDAVNEEESRGEPVRDLPELDPATISSEAVALSDWPEAAERATHPETADGVFALVGGTVHPVSGPAIEDGVVVVENGWISAVGPRSEVQIPQAAETHEVSGRHVYPGLIDANTALGLVEIEAIDVSRDDETVGEYNPHLRAVAGINPQSHAIPVARANGITAALTSPGSGTIEASGSLIQLKGDTPERASILDRAAIMVDFPGVSGQEWEEPKLEGGDLEELIELFERARLYAEAPSAAVDPTAPFGPQVRPGDAVMLRALAPALRGEMPVFFGDVESEREIRTLLLFLDEFPSVEAVIVGGDQAYRVADELAEREIPVLVGSERSPTMDRDDPVSAGWENAARLHDAGVKVAFTTSSVADVRTLPEHAAKARAYGLPDRIALQGVTLAPAQILGLGQVMGSIDEGKRADLIVTDGDPLQITTQVERIFIGGEEVSTESKHTRLWQEFRDREGGKPQP